MAYEKIREEELKNKVAQDYFGDFDCTKIIGNIDFSVTMKSSREQAELHELQSFLWAEAKKEKSDIYKSIVQLILTIGKARTFDKQLPPPWLGAFDAFQIAFIPYNAVNDIFYQNDFNWNVTPSNYETKEFKLLFETVKNTIDDNSMIFSFGKDDKEIGSFIKDNFVVGKTENNKIRIDKNNFMVVYNKWLTAVKPEIGMNWEIAKKYGIIDGDFYLADLLADENKTLKDKLYVLLKTDRYILDRKLDEMGLVNNKTADFNDNQKAHKKFWNKYERPPKEEYWDYILNRRDLLVPQDVRERKGSFFTPQIWVELSQQYLSDTLGEDWQEEYYIWDCAAGTGNLLTGLTNKYNIWASTLDKQDVDVMHDRIKNGANLLESHVFQFDFLNDDFTKLPQGLQDIINAPEKRKKLVVYINPPYAESNGKITNTRSNIQDTYIHTKYGLKLGKAAPELFAQFLARIYFEISGCIIGEFSKLKLITGGNSAVFRTHFLAELKKLFVVPADTFDNVKGKFPIGFFIWQTAPTTKGKKAKAIARFMQIQADVYDGKANKTGVKTFYSHDDENSRLNDWLNLYKLKKSAEYIGVLVADAPDFQHNTAVCILNERGIGNFKYVTISKDNLMQTCIYFAVRHAIAATWLNDRDQFLYPNKGWETDTTFQNDCLAFTLFDGQNQICAKDKLNNWIPFSESEVNAKDKFNSNFMSRYISGKIEITPTAQKTLKTLITTPTRQSPLIFSAEAKAVFDAGRELWRYYHAQPNCNVNASLYDIREHFQGRSAAGRMNSSSSDTQYTSYIKALREALKVLGKCIAEKVYLYGFLK